MGRAAQHHMTVAIPEKTVCLSDTFSVAVPEKTQGQTLA